MVIVGLCEGPNSVLWNIGKDAFEGGILICPSPQEHQAGFAPRWLEVLSRFALQPSCIEFVLPHGKLDAGGCLTATEMIQGILLRRIQRRLDTGMSYKGHHLEAFRCPDLGVFPKDRNIRPQLTTSRLMQPSVVVGSYRLMRSLPRSVFVVDYSARGLVNKGKAVVRDKNVLPTAWRALGVRACRPESERIPLSNPASRRLVSRYVETSSLYSPRDTV
jgi:hypothetical protein